MDISNVIDMQAYAEDAKFSQIERAMDAMANNWEISVVLTDDDVARHFDAFNDLMDEKIDFATFLKRCNIEGH